MGLEVGALNSSEDVKSSLCWHWPIICTKLNWCFLLLSIEISFDKITSDWNLLLFQFHSGHDAKPCSGSTDVLGKTLDLGKLTGTRLGRCYKWVVREITMFFPEI